MKAAGVFEDSVSLRWRACLWRKRGLHLSSPFILPMHWNRNYVTGRAARERERERGWAPGVTIDLPLRKYLLPQCRLSPSVVNEIDGIADVIANTDRVITRPSSVLIALPHDSDEKANPYPSVKVKGKDLSSLATFSFHDLNSTILISNFRDYYRIKLF